MAAKKKLDFEGSMARLEEIVSLLEKGDAPMEQAMALFEEGARRSCGGALLGQWLTWKIALQREWPWIRR